MDIEDDMGLKFSQKPTLKLLQDEIPLFLAPNLSLDLCKRDKLSSVPTLCIICNVYYCWNGVRGKLSTPFDQLLKYKSFVGVGVANLFDHFKHGLS